MCTNVINGNVIIENEIEIEFIYRSFDFSVFGIVIVANAHGFSTNLRQPISYL